MNILAFEGTNFDIKPNGDGTFKAEINIPGNEVCRPPVKVTIPRCEICFNSLCDENKAEHPYIVEVYCDESSKALALFTVIDVH